MSDATADLLRLLGLVLVLGIIGGGLTFHLYGSMGLVVVMMLPAVLLFVASALVLVVVDRV